MSTLREAPWPRRHARPLLRPAALVVVAALLAPAPVRAGCGHYVLFGAGQRPGSSARNGGANDRAPAGVPACPCRGPSCSRPTPAPPAPAPAPTNHAPTDWPYLGASDPGISRNTSLDRPGEGSAPAPEGFVLSIYHPPR